MKSAYEKLRMELDNFLEFGYSGYIQVVWKQKLYDICLLLSIDKPSWLNQGALFRLRNIYQLFSSSYRIIPKFELDDRQLLIYIIQNLLDNWDNYIERTAPRTADELLIMMTFEQTSMKQHFKDQFAKLHMTYFTKESGQPFHIWGTDCPAVFYNRLGQTICETYAMRLYFRDLQTIIVYHHDNRCFAGPLID